MIKNKRTKRKWLVMVIVMNETSKAQAFEKKKDALRFFVSSFNRQVKLIDIDKRIFSIQCVLFESKGDDGCWLIKMGTHGDKVFDTCNRLGCGGLIQWGPLSEAEGCYCHHTIPPCSHCCDEGHVYCPECGYEVLS